MSSQEFAELLGILPSLSLDQLRLLQHGCAMAESSARTDKSVVLTEAELADQELQHRLLMTGLVSEIKPPARLMAPREAYVPIDLGGEPLSVTIIRERR